MAVFKSGKRRSLNALLRDRRGTSAIEFAIVFPVFMTIMMSSFEVGWFYFVNATVDAATINIAREIRTGQIRGDQTFDPDQFFADEVCPKLDYFGECDTRLTANVSKTMTSAVSRVS
ncbi:MAG: TadE/TadG family type IV pilus assembly protein, partial [Pseudomonadota bacterium]